MTELLTAAQMRAIEAAAIASGEVTGLELMERAGRGVVEAIWEEWPELKAGSFRAVVLCGPGNNGGDGFVVARLLKEWGWTVEVFASGPSIGPDAKTMRAGWHGPVHGLEALDWTSLQDRPLVIDAFFGTGLSRPIDPRIWGALETAQSNCRVVAIDIPSGICADSGRYLAEGEASPWPADLTVTFGYGKRGHHLDAGGRLSSRLRVVKIGVEDHLFRQLRASPVEFVESTGAPGPAYAKKTEGHKYSHGHALILSGGAGRGGAARLAARGALRIGAGLVTVGCPPEALPENAARLDAVMLRAVADAGALAEMLEDPRISALCLGPGLGTGEREAALVAVALGLRKGPLPPAPPHEGEGSRSAPGDATGERALPLPPVGKGAPRPLVLDADALTILAQDPGLFAALHQNCVLTPHAGEFARLFPDIAEKLAAPATKGPAYSKVDATRAAARRAGCVVLFKGPDTVIANPSGRCSINSAHYDRAAPWLATAGSGDVLAGFIAGLLARGFAPMQAAETAAWLHVECALSFGPGLIAEDLPEQLPAVFRKLGL